METTVHQVRYTARVRRGFAILLAQRLASGVEQLLATNANLPRAERMNTSEVTDLQTCLAWMTQEADGGQPGATEGGAE